MKGLIKLLFQLLPSNSDVTVSVRWKKNMTGPERFLSNLVNKSSLNYSFRGLGNSKVFFVISNTSIYALLLAKLIGKFIVVRTDGFSLPRRYLPSGKNIPKTRAFGIKRIKSNYSMSLTQYYADVVIYQSDFSREMSSKHIYPIKSNSKVIYNGVDTNHFNIVKQQEDLRICVLGNFRDIDLMEFYLKSFNSLRKVHPTAKLYVIGKIHEEVQDFIGKSSFYLSPSVEFVGEYTYDELPFLLSKTNVGWHFTLWDWCPNSVLEQMASGNPVICFEPGGTKELVSTSDDVLSIYGYDEVGSVQKVVDRTLIVWMNIEDYRLKAKKRISDNFTIPIMQRNYENVFFPERGS